MNVMPQDPSFGEEQQNRSLEKRRRRMARIIGLCAVIGLAALVGFGIWTQSSRKADANAVLAAQKDTVPKVRTIIVKDATAPRTIELPANMAAFDSATLYARATGYIGKRNVDIGSKVHKGDVLAVISAPDLDQQLDQARAQLTQLKAAVDQAQATAELGQVTNQRTSRLVVQGWSSQQQGDQDRLNSASQTAGVNVARANVQAQEATVHRLEELTGFEKVVAPFDGVITSRLVDVGSLVTADAASGSPLFSIARTDVLRIQVYLPQTYYFSIKDGDKATLTVPELAGRVFEGTVARNAQALSANTRTLLTEVDVDNKDGALTAGLYCILHLQENRARYPSIPSQAVIFNDKGLSAAIVTDGKVEIRKIEIEADNGADVEIRTGLKAGDQLIVTPPANIVEGMRVTTG